jgi:translation initiation factor 2B subunit (eIF-2B alpha/beta/delta family)
MYHICSDYYSHLPKFRQIVGSYEVAKETAIILRQVVSTTRWSDASALVQIITDLGRRLAAAQPKVQYPRNDGKAAHQKHKLTYPL